MNVQEAYEKLNALIPDNSSFVMFHEGSPHATLDGEYSPSELRAIADVLDEFNKQK